MPSRQQSDQNDDRLYLPDPSGWAAKIKQGWEKDYCHFKNPGEDHFHLLMGGEVYLERGNEKYCLRCAVRRGVVTRDRLYWQRQPARTKKSP